VLGEDLPVTSDISVSLRPSPFEPEDKYINIEAIDTKKNGSECFNYVVHQTVHHTSSPTRSLDFPELVKKL
jgi:rRNA maturation protein Nop10